MAQQKAGTPCDQSVAFLRVKNKRKIRAEHCEYLTHDPECLHHLKLSVCSERGYCRCGSSLGCHNGTSSNHHFISNSFVNSVNLLLFPGFFFNLFVFWDRISLCSFGTCPGTNSLRLASNLQRSTFLCLWNAGIKGVCHHHLAIGVNLVFKKMS